MKHLDFEHGQKHSAKNPFAVFWPSGVLDVDLEVSTCGAGTTLAQKQFIIAHNTISVYKRINAVILRQTRCTLKL